MSVGIVLGLAPICRAFSHCDAAAGKAQACKTPFLQHIDLWEMLNRHGDAIGPTEFRRQVSGVGKQRLQISKGSLSGLYALGPGERGRCLLSYLTLPEKGVLSRLWPLSLM